APAKRRAAGAHEGGASRQRARLRLRRRDHPEVRATCWPRAAAGARRRAARRGPRPRDARGRGAARRADVHFGRGASMKLFVAFALMLAAQAGHTAYPERPITLIVAYPPGGGTDLIARAL